MALALWTRRPLDAPLSILDRAMARFELRDLDFAFDVDQLRPPHPFAELLRRAFAPKLDASAPIITPIKTNARCGSSESALEAMHAEWQSTITRFAARYGLWPPLELDDDEDGNPM